ncbi:MAG: class I SAM-dependent methyltransferase [Anaplasmataceae bacterium]|nr:class I SAM-dependent methyltransferase [Anaplasmataceae bacterium]
MGTKALKNPLDAWVYQEIIYEVQPDIIVEIGSYEGGSTMYLANLLDIIKKGQVISIDIDRKNFHINHPRILTVTGHSTSPTVLEKVKSIVENKKVLIIHDGDHHTQQVLEDLRAYAPLVSEGSYFIVEDGVVDLFEIKEELANFNDGPLAAIEIFLQENKSFAVDKDKEKYIITYNPNGYLRKIKS